MYFPEMFSVISTSSQKMRWFSFSLHILSAIFLFPIVLLLYSVAEVLSSGSGRFPIYISCHSCMACCTHSPESCYQPVSPLYFLAQLHWIVLNHVRCHYGRTCRRRCLRSVEPLLNDWISYRYATQVTTVRSVQVMRCYLV